MTDHGQEPITFRQFLLELHWLNNTPRAEAEQSVAEVFAEDQVADPDEIRPRQEWWDEARG